MRRGEIHWAIADPSVGREQSGRRPVLIISSNDALDVIPTVVTVVPLTTRSQPWGSRIEVTGDTSLTVPSWAMCEQVRTISTDRLRGRLGAADVTTVSSVDQVLRYVLDLP